MFKVGDKVRLKRRYTVEGGETNEGFVQRTGKGWGIYTVSAVSRAGRYIGLDSSRDAGCLSERFELAEYRVDEWCID